MSEPDPPILVIRMWPRDTECRLCGVPLVEPRYGVPMYEDLVLPNDTSHIHFGDYIRGWDGEWGGFDACERCYEAQGRLIAPMTEAEFLRFRNELDEEPQLAPRELGGIP